MGEIIKLKIPKKLNIENSDPNNILTEGSSVWICNCGAVLFFLTPDGPVCQQCGANGSDWVNL